MTKTGKKPVEPQEDTATGVPPASRGLQSGQTPWYFGFLDLLTKVVATAQAESPFVRRAGTSSSVKPAGGKSLLDLVFGRAGRQGRASR